MTLIELLIFIGLLGMVAVFALPLFYSSTENRMLQQTISIVEQNGSQSMQILEHRIRHAERILSPAIGATSQVLTLQTGSGTTDPTIIGIVSGSLVIIQGTVKHTITSSQVAVEDFRVRNTSVSGSIPSVWMSYKISRIVRLQQPRIYDQIFQTVVSLLPDSAPRVASCGVCIDAYCDIDSMYTWEVCGSSGVCETAVTRLDCP